MLNGDKVVLRPVRERDLPAFIDVHTEISNRGEFFPLGVQSESVLRRNYAETGFWERDEGTLLIWNRDEVMVGHIEFFRPVNYWDASELLPAVRPGARRPGLHDRGGARGAFFTGGRSIDVLIYSLLRDDPRPWRKPD